MVKNLNDYQNKTSKHLNEKLGKSMMVRGSYTNKKEVSSENTIELQYTNSNLTPDSNHLNLSKISAKRIQKVREEFIEFKNIDDTQMI